MTTDWTEIMLKIHLQPYFFTDKMKDCFVFDNPCSYSIKDFMIMFKISADDVMVMFERGLRKYKNIKRKGGRIINDWDC